MGAYHAMCRKCGSCHTSPIAEDALCPRCVPRIVMYDMGSIHKAELKRFERFNVPMTLFGRPFGRRTWHRRILDGLFE